MKTLLLSAAALVVALSSVAQGCDQLFISEYVVGTGNNKAYELYNPTANDIDLDGYLLERWSNGEQAPTDTTTLAGIIPAYGTWVVTNGQTEDIDLGTFISPAVDPALLALADQPDQPYPAPTFMNGNDALLLILNGTEICDIFGRPGEDPGQAWTAPDGTFITDSQTMVRKMNVVQGVTTPPIGFEPMLEYDTLGIDNWSNLGIHACECDPSTVGIEDRESLEISVFPNPIAGDDKVSIKANYNVEKVEIFDITGKMVKTINLEITGTETQVDIADLNSGAYIFNVYMANNVTFSTRLIKQ